MLTIPRVVVNEDRNEGAGRAFRPALADGDDLGFEGVHALTVAFGGANLQAEFLFQVATNETAYAVRLPAGGSHEGVECGALGLSHERNHPGRLGVSGSCGSYCSGDF